MPETEKPLRIGVSACLLGEAVRFDGGHKRDAFLADVLKPYVEWVTVCPETEMGLGVPRETLRLIDQPGGPRLVSASGRDHTEVMQQWNRARLDQLEMLDLCGFVFKRRSPSCGMERVKVYGAGNPLHAHGTGLFASALMKRFPGLPVEEEGRLNDPRLRENFISSVLAYRRWQELERGGLRRFAVMQFHARHKFLLMARDQDGARRLGRLTAAGTEYFALFSKVMRRTPTRRNHTNVLQHMAGYFSRRLAPADRAEMSQAIESYRRATVPLIVPVTLLRHYVRKYVLAYLESQIYLYPHPPGLGLLNQL